MNYKIVYVSNAILPSETSHCLSIMKMCQAFAEAGHSVTLIGVASNKTEIDPFKYYGLKKSFSLKLKKFDARLGWLPFRRVLRGLLLAFYVREVVKVTKPDFVYSRLTLYELFFLDSKMPVLYEMHNTGQLTSDFLSQRLFRWLLASKNFRSLIVTSDLLANWLKQKVPNQRLTLARLSAELPMPLEQDQREAFANENLQGNEFRFHVGYTGYLDRVELRGTEIICELASKVPQAAFHIVGGEKEAVQYWRNLSEQWNQNQNLFFYGHRASSEIPGFLQSFDVVLAPLQFMKSRGTPLGKGLSPLKIAQYMAYGRSIIASDIPQHREILEDNKTALLVDPTDLDTWVKAMTKLLNDNDLRIKLGKNAAEYYRSNLTPDIRLQKVLAAVA
jgi:glycosyltransferase involved in cell wall biosynthesis